MKEGSGGAGGAEERGSGGSGGGKREEVDRLGCHKQHIN